MKRSGSFEWYTWSQEKTSENFEEQKQCLLMKTEKEFCDIMMAKGKSKEWAQAEFIARRQDGSGWKKDNDPDCGLPRCQMHGETENNFGNRKADTNKLTLAEKTVKKPKVNDANKSIEHMREELNKGLSTFSHDKSKALPFETHMRVQLDMPDIDKFLPDSSPSKPVSTIAAESPRTELGH